VSEPPLVMLGDTGGVKLLDLLPERDTGKVEEDALSPKPNLLMGFGGNGGGRSSALLVLPVFCLVLGLDASVT
jgi:hypothetical protein